MAGVGVTQIKHYIAEIKYGNNALFSLTKWSLMIPPG
jgi:hypothetical protein